MAMSPGGRPADDSSFGNGPNWVSKTMVGLPRYIRMVAHALVRGGHTESEAIAIAVATMRRWAAGGDKVSPKVQAAAAKAVTEWEALRASSHSHANERTDAIDLARKQKLPAVANKLHGHAKQHRTRAIRMYKAGNLNGARKAWATAKKIDQMAKGTK